MKLAGGVLLVLCAALAVAATWISRTEAQRFRAQNAAHAAQTAAVVASSLSERMLAGGGASVWKDVTVLSQELRDATGALRIQVVSRAGLVKASTEHRDVGHRYQQQQDAECVPCHTGARQPFPAVVQLAGRSSSILRVLAPIPKQPACSRCHTANEAFRGMIAVDFDYTPVERAAGERNSLLLGIAGVAAVAMFALIIVLLRHLVHQPVRSLVEAANRLSSGDFSLRLPVRRQDELGQLTVSFNHMVAQLDQQVATLELNNMELDLLYTLVVEVSRSMEVRQVQSTVLRILRERLKLESVVFCVEDGEGWCCVSIGDNGQEQQQRGQGQGQMQACIVDPSGGRDRFRPVPSQVVDAACTSRQAVSKVLGDYWHFAMPFFSNDQLIGLLAGDRRASDRALQFDSELLVNLAVHVGLALENARNFTQAITDGLTGFHTKRYGLTRLEEAVYKAQRYDTPLALLMCDIDHFKRVNDTYGHPAGDAVLREVSRRLHERARKSDIVVRYGGEEFMTILPHTDQGQVEVVAEAFRQAVAREAISLPGGGDPIQVTISVGVAVYRRGIDDMDALIARADQALYRAKASGRNRVVGEQQGS